MACVAQDGLDIAESGEVSPESRERATKLTHVSSQQVGSILDEEQYMWVDVSTMSDELLQVHCEFRLGGRHDRKKKSTTGVIVRRGKH